MSGSQQLLLAAVQQAVATDPNFEYTTLLLPGNGTNGAQNNTFLDSSTNNFTITRNGNTTQGSFSPFSQTGWSNYFDGSGDSLTASADITPRGTEDFTIELWYYPTTLAAADRYFIVGGSNGSLIFGIANGGNDLCIIRDISGTVVANFGSRTQLTANVWNYVAVTRSGNTFRCYINGNPTTTASVTSSYSFATPSGTTMFPQSFAGYASQFRVSRGTARYTGATMTVPTAPTTSDANTTFLSCQSNRFIDNSTNAYAITRNGDVSVQPFSPFNPLTPYSTSTVGGSGYFDGSGDYLSVANNSAFNLGTNSFCIDGWFYPTTTNATQLVFNKWGTVSDAQSMFQIGRISSTFYAQLRTTSGYVTLSTATWIPNAWNHFAVVRSGSTISAYLNGTRFGTDTSNPTLNSGTDTMTIGSKQAQDYFTGYISDCRIVNGSAIYDPTQTSITVPTAPTTAVTNTAFLSSSTNAGIYDATSKNDLETVGNAQISTTQSKFGGSSIYLDGTGDYLSGPTSALMAFGTGDFTIEGWVYFGSVSGNPVIFSSGTYNTSQFTLRVSSSKFQFFAGNGGTVLVSGTTTLSTSTWYYFAVVRSSGTTKLYVNGTSEATDSTAFTYAPTGSFAVGEQIGNSGQLNGYIQDLRITKGVARYTANFTAPTAAFPLL